MSIGKGRIRESIGNGGSGRVPEMWDLGEYRKCGIRATTEKVKSGRVPEKVGSYRKWGIWASTGNVGSGRVPEKVKSRRVPEKEKSGRVPEKVGSERVSEMGDLGE